MKNDSKSPSDNEKSPLVLDAFEKTPASTTKANPRLIGDSTLKIDDLLLVTDAEIQEKTLVNHHVESMNDLYLNGIHQIITQIFNVEKDIENKRTNTFSKK